MLARLALLLIGLSGPAFAEGVVIHDPYARVIAGSGVVLFLIENQTDVSDRLVSARSDLGMAMLMNDSQDANGVMKMRMVMDGFEVAPHQTRLLTNAADHVMLSGVTAKPKTGDLITVVLTFEVAGDITVTLPVDNARRTDPGMGPTPHDATSSP